MREEGGLEGKEPARWSREMGGNGGYSFIDLGQVEACGCEG